MKKTILFFLSFVFGFSLIQIQNTKAQNFEFELIKTENAPGFFMIRIFPIGENKEISVTPVFVKNFSPEDAPLYEEIITFLQEMNEIVIGYNTSGIGSNTAVLGNDNILITALKGKVGVGTTTPTSNLQVIGLPEYADNAAAIAGGLTVGAFYRTGDLLKVVH